MSRPKEMSSRRRYLLTQPKEWVPEENVEVHATYEEENYSTPNLEGVNEQTLRI